MLGFSSSIVNSVKYAERTGQTVLRKTRESG
jgi:hypothetical protein